MCSWQYFVYLLQDNSFIVDTFQFLGRCKTTFGYQSAAAITGLMLGGILSLQSVSDPVLASFPVEL